MCSRPPTARCLLVSRASGCLAVWPVPSPGPCPSCHPNFFRSRHHTPLLTTGSRRHFHQGADFKLDLQSWWPEVSSFNSIQLQVFTEWSGCKFKKTGSLPGSSSDPVQGFHLPPPCGSRSPQRPAPALPPRSSHPHRLHWPDGDQPSCALSPRTPSSLPLWVPSLEIRG